MIDFIAAFNRYTYTFSEFLMTFLILISSRLKFQSSILTAMAVAMAMAMNADRKERKN